MSNFKAALRVFALIRGTNGDRLARQGKTVELFQFDSDFAFAAVLQIVTSKQFDIVTDMDIIAVEFIVPFSSLSIDF